MDERSFITEIRSIFALAPVERFEAMGAFHRTIHAAYTRAIQEITPERAASVSTDGRLVSQVVGHIMEWERFTLFCLGELLSGVRSRKLLWKNGYVDKAGEPFNFGTLDAFNAFQAERQQNLPWAEIQSDAINMAYTLLNLLSNQAVISPALLENTDTISPELYDAQRLPIPSGWFLWYVILDHEAVEHARDLYNSKE
jgi:hypothetical protein